MIRPERLLAILARRVEDGAGTELSTSLSASLVYSCQHVVPSLSYAFSGTQPAVPDHSLQDSTRKRGPFQWTHAHGRIHAEGTLDALDNALAILAYLPQSRSILGHQNTRRFAESLMLSKGITSSPRGVALSRIVASSLVSSPQASTQSTAYLLFLGGALTRPLDVKRTTRHSGVAGDSADRGGEDASPPSVVSLLNGRAVSQNAPSDERYDTRVAERQQMLRILSLLEGRLPSPENGFATRQRTFQKRGGSTSVNAPGMRANTAPGAWKDVPPSNEEEKNYLLDLRTSSNFSVNEAEYIVLVKLTLQWLTEVLKETALHNLEFSASESQIFYGFTAHLAELLPVHPLFDTRCSTFGTRALTNMEWQSLLHCVTAPPAIASGVFAREGLKAFSAVESICREQNRPLLGGLYPRSAHLMRQRAIIGFSRTVITVEGKLNSRKVKEDFVKSFTAVVPALLRESAASPLTMESSEGGADSTILYESVLTECTTSLLVTLLTVLQRVYLLLFDVYLESAKQGEEADVSGMQLKILEDLLDATLREAHRRDEKGNADDAQRAPVRSLESIEPTLLSVQAALHLHLHAVARAPAFSDEHIARQTKTCLTVVSAFMKEKYTAQSFFFHNWVEVLRPALFVLQESDSVTLSHLTGLACDTLLEIVGALTHLVQLMVEPREGNVDEARRHLHSLPYALEFLQRQIVNRSVAGASAGGLQKAGRLEKCYAPLKRATMALAYASTQLYACSDDSLLRQREHPFPRESDTDAGRETNVTFSLRRYRVSAIVKGLSILSASGWTKDEPASEATPSTEISSHRHYTTDRNEDVLREAALFVLRDFAQRQRVDVSPSDIGDVLLTAGAMSDLGLLDNAIMTAVVEAVRSSAAPEHIPRISWKLRCSVCRRCHLLYRVVEPHFAVLKSARQLGQQTIVLATRLCMERYAPAASVPSSALSSRAAGASHRHIPKESSVSRSSPPDPFTRQCAEHIWALSVTVTTRPLRKLALEKYLVILTRFVRQNWRFPFSESNDTRAAEPRARTRPGRQRTVTRETLLAAETALINESHKALRETAALRESAVAATSPEAMVDELVRYNVALLSIARRLSIMTTVVGREDREVRKRKAKRYYLLYAVFASVVLQHSELVIPSVWHRALFATRLRLFLEPAGYYTAPLRCLLEVSVREVMLHVQECGNKGQWVGTSITTAPISDQKATEGSQTELTTRPSSAVAVLLEPIAIVRLFSEVNSVVNVAAKEELLLLATEAVKSTVAAESAARLATPRPGEAVAQKSAQADAHDTAGALLSMTLSGLRRAGKSFRKC